MSLSFAPLFADHMVLQQGLEVPVWGNCAAGATVKVVFGDRRAQTVADAGGRWKVKLPPMPACAQPRDLVVTAWTAGGREQTLACRDVLVGEVWVCSGQSNMEWPVALSKDSSNEIEQADYPLIRLLAVPKRPMIEPDDQCPGAVWWVCSPKTIALPTAGYAFGFSAVGYFFGRELYRQLGVPIGLINASVGGTCAQTWISREGLLTELAIRDIWDDFQRDIPTLEQRSEKWQQELRALEQRTRDVENLGFARGYAGPNEPGDGWRDMTLPANWLREGLDFNGIVWFRRTVDIPPAWAGKDLRLSIGATDKSDVTYFNNQQVGSVTMQQREDAWCLPRVYTIPGALVKSGPNVIAVRVHSDRYDAGIMGPAAIMSLSCSALPEAPAIPLPGVWRYMVESSYGNVVVPPQPLAPGVINAPTALFNGMIAPLAPFGIRGVIWYQGESNVADAVQYRTLFPALIRDWRRHWGMDQLAFYFVQLANYMDTQAQPGESQWAELREAQTMTLRLPGTGMAVAIDVGEAQDIHPRNKQDVGLRLARIALHQTYGKNEIAPCGPMFRQLNPEGNALRIMFDHVDGGLVCRGEVLKGFAIAGHDGAFVRADARIDGDTVQVSSESIRHPRHVRYAWADNPICNLYNAAGLPASPFRHDLE